MFRVMLIADPCHFGKGLSTEQFVKTGRWRRAARDYWAGVGLQRRYLIRLLFLFFSLQFVGCVREQQPSPEIVAQIQTLEQRTVPSNGWLTRTATVTRRSMSVDAEWQVRLSSGNQDYFDWLRQHLGADYHVVSQTKSILSMGKTLPGDSYTLEFENIAGSTVNIHFSARGD